MAEEINALLNNEEQFKQVVQASFSSVDTDGSGHIDSSELKNALTELSKQAEIGAPSDDEVAAAMKELDTDQDGKVSTEEFGVLVRTILQAVAASLA